MKRMKNFRLLLSFIINSFIFVPCRSQYPVVHLEDGSVMGTINTTEGLGITYHAFRGIPYAAPPIGDLRFKAPIPHEKWSGTFDARNDGPQCIQGLNPLTYTGSEDCLTINVYSPSISCNSNLSTMVWIYGGGFVGGSSSYETFGPDYLLDNCVCFVSFNYRTGIFGFISTGDKAASGNYGLKDQRLALQWVQKNIQKFGCSNENILVFGESAGAASVSILLQSKSTKGLIHKAIMQSGTSLCMWSRARYARKIAFKTGWLLGIETLNSRTLIEQLRKRSVAEIHKASVDVWLAFVTYDPLNQLMGIGPVLEKESEEAILTTNSYETLLQGKSEAIPTIIGFTSDEGNGIDTFPLSLISNAYSLSYTSFMKTLVPANMGVTNIWQNVKATWAITKKYFGVLPILNQNKLHNLIKYVSDTSFIKPSITEAKLQSKVSNVFMYRFSYLGKNVKNATGVGHTGELPYLFKVNGNALENESDKIVRLKFCKLWTNMAHNGFPTSRADSILDNVSWNPISNSNVTFIDIDEQLKEIPNPYEEVMEFWDTVYTKYGSRPFDTY